MSLLDRAKRVVGDLAEEASRGAGWLELQAEKDALRSRLEETYARAGRRAEVLYKTQRIADAELADALKLADGLTERIKEIEEQVRASKEGREPDVICPGCKKVLARGVQFCSVCGTQIRPCPQCHTVLKPDERFCPGCGTKVAVQESGARGQGLTPDA